MVGIERALERSECHVDLESLADVLAAFCTDFVAFETARAKQGATTDCEPLLTTKRAYFGLRWWERGCALEGGEGLVELEGLADVLGTLIA
eukprot:scaffold9130_cov124-Isochrysis_galbana.AAC.6